ncbi:hypothetical protein HK405_005210 [Cladochytrium tenue]|nr:hypothetical protein HK405_005210 [Cladochytrium tenue]
MFVSVAVRILAAAAGVPTIGIRQSGRSYHDARIDAELLALLADNGSSHAGESSALPSYWLHRETDHIAVPASPMHTPPHDEAAVRFPAAAGLPPPEQFQETAPADILWSLTPVEGLPRTADSVPEVDINAFATLFGLITDGHEGLVPK